MESSSSRKQQVDTFKAKITFLRKKIFTLIYAVEYNTIRKKIYENKIPNKFVDLATFQMENNYNNNKTASLG